MTRSEEGLGNARIVECNPNQQIHFVGKCGNEGLGRRARSKKKGNVFKAEDKRNLGDAPGYEESVNNAPFQTNVSYLKTLHSDPGPHIFH